MGKKPRINQDADGFDIPDESTKCLLLFCVIYFLQFYLVKPKLKS